MVGGIGFPRKPRLAHSRPTTRNDATLEQDSKRSKPEARGRAFRSRDS